MQAILPSELKNMLLKNILSQTQRASSMQNLDSQLLSLLSCVFEPSDSSSVEALAARLPLVVPAES
jgi:hypothetical protein